MDKNDLEFDFNEAAERLQFNLDDIKLFRDKLGPGVPNDLTDKQCVLFLNACCGVDEAVKVLKIYYDARKNAPEHFSKRDPLDDTIKQCFDNQKYFTIPPTEKEGCPIVYHKITNPSASTYFFDNAMKTYCITTDMALHKYGPRPGIIFVHDMQFVGFSHMLRASISSIRKYCHYLQYGLPAKVCRIHVFNVIPLFNKILTLLKPFLKKELVEIIHVHQANINYEDFYRDWIPKSHLPSEYGGDLKSIDDLSEEFYKDVIAARGFLLAEEEQRTRIEYSDKDKK